MHVDKTEMSTHNTKRINLPVSSENKEEVEKKQTNETIVISRHVRVNEQVHVLTE
jgi:hypothetical protein